MTNLAPPSALPLDGHELVTLRAAGEAGLLLSMLRALGASAFNLPLLRLRAVPAAEAATCLRGALDATHWIFSSPAAVRHARRLDRRLKSGLFEARGPLMRAAAAGSIFAPGPGTARALAQAGIAPVACPARRLDSEGLLALPGLAAPLSATLALVGASGGRGLLEPTLAARGARVIEVHVYRREAHRPPARLRARADRLRAPMLIVSSLVALQRAADVLPGATLQRWQALGQVIVASERLASHARSLGFQRCRVARSARAEAMVTAALAATDGACEPSGHVDSVSMTA